MSSSDFISYDRPYLTALPAGDLVGRLRQHADTEIHNKLRYIVRADKLMRAAADRISMLESELHRRACQGHLGAFHDREELATADLRPQLRLQGVKRGGEPAECLKCRARKRQDRPQDPAHRRRGAGKPQLSQHFLIGHADVISNHD